MVTHTRKTRLLRFKEVIERTGKSRSAIYVLINQGQFPTPVRLGQKSVAFVESEIDAWIEARLRDRVTWVLHEDLSLIETGG